MQQCMRRKEDGMMNREEPFIMDNTKKVLQCLENIGLEIDEEEKEMNLRDILQDSLLFISFIVEVEEVFKIQVDDSFLVIDNLKTIQEFAEDIVVLQVDKQLVR